MQQNAPRQRLLQANSDTDILMKQFYGYSVRFLNLASGAQATASFNIQSDSAFMLQNLNAYVVETGTASVVDAPNALVQITDTGSGANIFDQAQPVSVLFGDAKLPYILPTPRILSANSVIQVSLSAVFLNADTDFYFAFFGRKLFGYTRN